MRFADKSTYLYFETTNKTIFYKKKTMEKINSLKNFTRVHRSRTQISNTAVSQKLRLQTFYNLVQEYHNVTNSLFWFNLGTL